MDACCGCGCMWLPVQLCLILSMSFVLSVYSRVHVLVFVCDSVCLCMRLCVCLYGCIVCASALHPLCMRVLGYTYSCVYVGMCAFSYVCMYVCTYVMYVHQYGFVDACSLLRVHICREESVVCLDVHLHSTPFCMFVSQCVCEIRQQI